MKTKSNMTKDKEKKIKLDQMHFNIPNLKWIASNALSELKIKLEK